MKDKERDELIEAANAVRSEMVSDLIEQGKSLGGLNWIEHPLFPKLSDLTRRTR